MSYIVWEGRASFFIALFFLNHWTLLDDKNKIKKEYMKSWENDKMVDNKTL